MKNIMSIQWENLIREKIFYIYILRDEFIKISKMLRLK